MQTDIKNKAMKPGDVSNKTEVDDAPQTDKTYSFFFEGKDGKPAQYIDAHSMSEARRIYEQTI